MDKKTANAVVEAETIAQWKKTGSRKELQEAAQNLLDKFQEGKGRNKSPEEWEEAIANILQDYHDEKEEYQKPNE